MEMLIGGTWQPAASGRTEDVTSPFDGAVVGTVPVADADDVRIALDRAEAGKTITEATGEASRSGDLIPLAAFEGTQLYGDVLPLDANRGTGLDKLGFTVRQPVGIVAAISPFNYPALLVMHKLAPALAAGNPVVLKPARTTPLTALPDADIELAATAVAASGYINAGQVCISGQRVITHPAVEADFIDALVPEVGAIRTGNPRSHQTTMGTLITAAEAERVQGSIRRAVDGGAKLLTGGERDGAVLAPARRSPR
jgi:acyl-CoA reductase-like NAD-dependent aldehyde dehydrogenase